jgi:glucose/arabinose dehydrogenase
MFLVEQPGRIRVVRNNVLESTPFLDISSRVLFGGEQGLLAVAFPPGYANKGHFYVSYTREPDGASVIARYFVPPGNPDVADPNSEEVLLTVAQPFPIHNAGLIAFGPDGYLYVSLGDGGSAEDSLNNAQNTDSLLGKILRIDVEEADFPYAVPPGNPFVGQEGYREEVWALGLRNPWRFSFDRQSGALYIADVGHNNWEEVNVEPPASTGGHNYGWRVMEGAHCRTPPIFCNPAGLTLPTYEYSHFQGCSIIGGFVYRGRAYPCLQGMYLYSDFCTGGVWGLKQVDGEWQSRILTDTPLQFVSFGEDEEGELYALDIMGGVHIVTLR